MAWYLHGTVLTNMAIAANNRGENNGNRSTLQHIHWLGDIHTVVNAEPIRRAIVLHLIMNGAKTNRTFDRISDKFSYTDPSFEKFQSEIYADDDLMGYMSAQAAKADSMEESEEEEGEETETKKKPKKPAGRGTCPKRRGPVSINKAVSLRPWMLDLSFNAKGATADNKNPTPYSVEQHATELQFPFSLNLTDVLNKEHIGYFAQAIVDLPQVAGNHGRYSYSFAPQSIIMRVTNTHCAGFAYPFTLKSAEGTDYDLTGLMYDIASGDIPAKEIIIGGRIAGTAVGEELKNRGCFVVQGVKAAQAEAIQRIVNIGKEYAVVKNGREEL